MRVIIAGSRNIADYKEVCNAVRNSGFVITRVLSGMARGVDTLAVRYAEDNRLPYDKCPADWRKHGKSAGYKRNVHMSENADALIAIWDGTSKGTKHMIDIATKRGLQVYVAKL